MPRNLRKFLSRRPRGRSASPALERLEPRRLFAGISFTEFPQIGQGTNFLQNLTAGTDGNVYFSSGLANNVASINAAGVVRIYDVTQVAPHGPSGVAVGTDGNVYFDVGNNFGKVTLPAGTVSDIPLSNALDAAGRLTLGPDGNFWEDSFFSVIERITPSGQVNDFSYSGSGSGQILSFNGQLYFTSGTSIRNVSTTGTFGSTFNTPSGGDVEAIAVGPDGNLWFTEQKSVSGTVTNYYGYLTKAGTMQEFPSALGPVSGIAAGSDGNIYFRAADYLVGVNTAGTVVATQNLGGGNNTDGKELVAGSDGNLYYNENFADRIGVAFLTASPTPTPTPVPTPTPTTPTPTPTPAPTPTPGSSPPQATTASSLPDAAVGSAAPYLFNVTFSDDSGLNSNTLTANAVSVIGPDGSALPVTFLSSTNVSANEDVVTYEIPAPTAAGNYRIQLVGGQVSDTSGNAAPGQAIGTFTAASSTPTPTPTPTPTGTSVSISSGVPAAATAGATGVLVVDLTNASGVRTNGAVTLRLFASTGATLDAGSVALDPAVHKHLHLATGAASAVRLKYALPATLPAGDYYVLAELSPGAGASSGGVVASAAPVHVAAQVVDLAGQFAPHPLLTVAAGGKGVAVVVVANEGNVAARGLLTISLDAAPAGGGASTLLTNFVRRVNLKAGAGKTFRIPFRIPAGTAASTYRLDAIVDSRDVFPDPDRANNSVTDPTPFTVG